MEKPVVLVADDNEATRTLIAAILQQSDYDVDLATDGLETIEKLKSRSYAAVLLDLVMPLADGYAVLDYIHAERRELMNSVVIVTAAVSPREIERVRRYPICSLVSKPFEVDHLVAMVQKCTNGDGASGSRGPLISSGMLLLLANIIRQRWM